MQWPDTARRGLREVEARCNAGGCCLSKTSQVVMVCSGFQHKVGLCRSLDGRREWEWQTPVGRGRSADWLDHSGGDRLQVYRPGISSSATCAGYFH